MAVTFLKNPANGRTVMHKVKILRKNEVGEPKIHGTVSYVN
jgi:hypothetical protein